ncbi:MULTISPECIES: hypothetical protein [Methylobacterium]|uniref:Uncharacterized protein n=3 Tax=Pseudomonadota TaxID=1224 RepID=A0ABQ4STI8_9HYPH|nr:MULTISPECIES: hypothetical protein [Methylobacterium]PIU08115.1 MAG: hypothetical protein COT56_02515 [Methylobacterium sp. CG09_land_8_20_14_0_10_71_15]PIU11136.1 MAG: hypothetical protein COT28_21540 [Methylobacterium sp. CG08_land_8_20_14_0_20_71_15]GBU16654.1 hypothetical protein AwMethylo_08690 [Methylobacterium sp.]GJE05551.1 hypothetical protein AOPFMNJM_0853 [Methylobacterium jeotgali]
MLGLSPARAAEETQIFGMTVSLPGASEGWARKDASDGVLLNRTWLREGRRGGGAALIQILKPVPGKPAALPEAFARFVATFKPLADKRPITKGGGLTVNGHAFVFDRRCCGRMNDISVDSVSVGIASPAGHHFLRFVSLGLSRDDEKAAEAEFEALVRSLRPQAGDRAFELKGDGKGFEGAYTHLSTGLRPNAFGGMDFYADNDVMLFDPSGLFSRRIPKHGLGIAEHCRTAPTECGTYRLLGGGFLRGPDRIELLEADNRFGMLTRREESFTRESGDLVIDKGRYRAIAPLARGTTFEGTWRHFFASSGSGAFTSGSVAVERMLTLGRDGRFRRSGFTGFSSTTESASVAGGRSRPAEAGHYAIEGRTLTLTGDDGTTERLSLFAPEAGSDKLLVIEGSNYLKQYRTAR